MESNFSFESYDPMNEEHLLFEKAFLKDRLNAYYVPNLFRTGTMLIKMKNCFIGACITSPSFDHNAILEYGLLEEYRHKGLAYQALKQVICTVFETTSIDTLVANIDQDNLASKTVLKQLGFEVDSTLSEAMQEEELASAYTLTKTYCNSHESMVK